MADREDRRGGAPVVAGHIDCQPIAHTIDEVAKPAEWLNRRSVSTPRHLVQLVEVLEKIRRADVQTETRTHGFPNSALTMALVETSENSRQFRPQVDRVGTEHFGLRVPL